MILLFTDFGTEGPYAGQVKAVLSVRAPGVPAIDLMHDAPAHNPRAAAYLLA
ncbi:MAG: SAM-dependent chlorinase/fluorinase, partial [Proteobacteria bacterium]|nr:SAM-dependent chlorinase/fluorinase [Pseudomonadota bacterium]